MRSKYNFFLIGLLLTVIVGIFGLFGTLSIFKVIEDLEYGVPFTKTLFIVPLIFFPFIFYTVYYLLTSFPVVTVDSIGIRLTTVFNSKSYYWADIEEIELTGKQPHKFLFVSMPTEATTIKFKDGTVFNLWADYYRNKSELRVILDRADAILKSNKKMTSLDFGINRPDYSNYHVTDNERIKFAGNHLFTFNGMLFYGWIIFITYMVSTKPQVFLSNYGAIFSISFVTFIFTGVLSYQMHNFIITDKYLVVKNSFWFWRNDIYSLSEIREVVIESPHKLATSLRVITYDFREKLYPAGSLSNKTWIDLMNHMKAEKVKVRNEIL